LSFFPRLVLVATTLPGRRSVPKCTPWPVRTRPSLPGAARVAPHSKRRPRARGDAVPRETNGTSFLTSTGSGSRAVSGGPASVGAESSVHGRRHALSRHPVAVRLGVRASGQGWGWAHAGPEGRPVAPGPGAEPTAQNSSATKQTNE
jgi:hypothetical protein